MVTTIEHNFDIEKTWRNFQTNLVIAYPIE
jgi:hypothetical protein